MAELSVEEWFATHGLPYDKEKAKELDDLGADSVEMLKLLEPGEWASLFANEKPLVRKKAQRVIENLIEEGFDSKKTATSIPLKKDGCTAAAAPASTKRNHSDLHSDRQTVNPKLFANKRRYAERGFEWTKDKAPPDNTGGMKNRYKGSNPKAKRKFDEFAASLAETPAPMDSDSDDGVEIVHEGSSEKPKASDASAAQPNDAEPRLAIAASNFRHGRCELSSELEDPAGDDERFCWRDSLVVGGMAI